VSPSFVCDVMSAPEYVYIITCMFCARKKTFYYQINDNDCLPFLSINEIAVAFPHKQALCKFNQNHKDQ
jgi:hypothetical protein